MGINFFNEYNIPIISIEQFYNFVNRLAKLHRFEYWNNWIAGYGIMINLNFIYDLS